MRKEIMKRNYDNEGNLISKECACCHEIKPVSEFNKCKSNADKLQTKCKECIKEYYKNNIERIKERNKEYHKEYYKNNAESFKERQKEYYKDNIEKIKKHSKQYYKNNAESFKERRKQYYKDNTESVKEYNKKYRKDNAEKIKEYNTKKIEEALQQIKIEVEKNPDKYNYTEGKEIYGIIYLVHNINSDKYYVGQTIIGFDNRYSKGWLYAHGYKNTVKHDLELYGENSFEYIKLFKVAYSQYELDKLEAYYIDYYNSYENGYNENRGNIFTDRGKEK